MQKGFKTSHKMKRDCFKLPIFLFINICFNFLINAEFNEETWMDPDAWAGDNIVNGDLESTINKCCKCSDVTSEHFDPEHHLSRNVEDIASLIYLKKLVAMLFNRKNFVYDSTQQHYERSIVFTIKSHQMDQLEQLQDPRDLDIILTEVFNNVRSPHIYSNAQQTSTGIQSIIYNIIYDVGQLIKTSEIRFILFVVIIVLIAWLINIKFKIGLLPLIFGSIFIYGYLHTYLECNRELEVNQMLEILKSDKENKNNAKGFKFINFFKEMFYNNDDQVLQQQKIKQSAKLSLGFCRPDHVLLMYFNDIFLKYLQMLIEQCSVTLSTLNGVLGFPYNIFSGFAMAYLILYILKLTFKHVLSPSAWRHLLHRRQSSYREQGPKKCAISSQDDRLSGDNLKMLINAINSAPPRIAVVQKLQNSSGVSGVENLTEAIQSNSEKDLQDKILADKSHENPLEEKTKKKSPTIYKTIVGTIEHNNSNENPSKEKTNTKIEDLSDDS